MVTSYAFEVRVRVFPIFWDNWFLRKILKKIAHLVKIIDKIVFRKKCWRMKCCMFAGRKNQLDQFDPTSIPLNMCCDTECTSITYGVCGTIAQYYICYSGKKSRKLWMLICACEHAWDWDSDWAVINELIFIIIKEFKDFLQQYNMEMDKAYHLSSYNLVGENGRCLMYLCLETKSRRNYLRLAILYRQ